MREIDLRNVEVALRGGESVATAAEGAGVAPRTLRRHWTERYGMSPSEWQRAEIGPQGDGESPVVAFRLPREAYQRFLDAAKDKGVKPAAFARAALLERLARGARPATRTRGQQERA